MGVGISPGKISVDNPLSHGVYNLPSITVTNTGEVAGNYEIEITYFEGQEELRPSAEWFDFNPDEPSYLEPGQSQKVAVNLEIPTDAGIGDYYTCIEAHPVIEEGGVSIGIAAATKLYFTVQHGSPSFLARNAFAFYITLGVVGLIVVIFLFLRFFHIRIRLSG